MFLLHSVFNMENVELGNRT